MLAKTVECPKGDLSLMNEAFSSLTEAKTFSEAAFRAGRVYYYLVRSGNSFKDPREDGKTIKEFIEAAAIRGARESLQALRDHPGSEAHALEFLADVMKSGRPLEGFVSLGELKRLVCPR